MSRKPKSPPRAHSLRARDAIFASDLESSERLVLQAYASHLNNRDWYAWPGTARLADMTGFTDRYVKTIRARLIRAGILREVKDWMTENRHFETIRRNYWRVPFSVPNEAADEYLKHESQGFDKHLRQKRRGHPNSGGRPSMCVEVCIEVIEGRKRP